MPFTRALREQNAALLRDAAITGGERDHLQFVISYSGTTSRELRRMRLLLRGAPRSDDRRIGGVMTAAQRNTLDRLIGSLATVGPEGDDGHDYADERDWLDNDLIGRTQASALIQFLTVRRREVDANLYGTRSRSFRRAAAAACGLHR